MEDIITIHIENLLLEGVSPSIGEEVAAELKRELARLLSQPGALEGFHSTRDFPQLDAGVFTMRPGMSPQDIGGSIARSVAGEIISQSSQQ